MRVSQSEKVASQESNTQVEEHRAEVQMRECSCYKTVMASAKVFWHSRNPRPAQHNIACSTFQLGLQHDPTRPQHTCINLSDKLSKCTFFVKPGVRRLRARLVGKEVTEQQGGVLVLVLALGPWSLAPGHHQLGSRGRVGLPRTYH